MAVVAIVVEVVFVVVVVIDVVIVVELVVVVEVAAGAEAVEEARDTSHPPPIGRPSYSCSHLPRCIIGITSHTSHVLHTMTPAQKHAQSHIIGCIHHRSYLWT